MLPVGLAGLRAAPARSRAPGEPLRSGLAWLRRAGFRSAAPARADVEPLALRLSRIDRPIRRFSVLLVPVVGLRVADLLEEETNGVLPLIELPMREVRPEELPTLEVRPELAAGCLASVETDGLSIRIELVVPGCEPAVGLSIRIELPIRDVLEELTRLRELAPDRLADEDTDGILVLNERPILDLVLLVGQFVEEETDGLLVVIELPIRALLLGLIRMLELLSIEVAPVEPLLMEMPDEGLRELEGLEIVIRLDVDPLAPLLEEIEPDRPGIDRLTDIRPELLLRLGAERLDVIVLDRLGVDRLTDGLLELLRLRVDRLGVGARLTDDLLELLRLGVGRL